MNIQWYPGHMTKARRAMQDAVKLIDLLIELVDARAPLSSRNPDIDELGKGKARLILLNKSDLAEERANEQWAAWFSAQGFQVVKMDSRSGAGSKQINGAVQAACREKIRRDRERGILNRPVRAMVVGIPNVGKSTFINTFAGKACTKTGNKPGVTKGNQWIRLNKSLELLDTPGILWPKFEDQEAGQKLAFIGSINDDILNKEELALELIRSLQVRYPKGLQERYGLGAGAPARSSESPTLEGSSSERSSEGASGDRREDLSAGTQVDRTEDLQAGLQVDRQNDLQADPRMDRTEDLQAGPRMDLQVGAGAPYIGAVSVLEQIAKVRGCLRKGGGYDLAKAANLFLDDFRGGRLGRITLEWPEE